MRTVPLPSMFVGVVVVAVAMVRAQVDRHLYTFQGDGPDALFGEAVAAIGDVNGDTVIDIAVGAPQDSTHGNRTGICRIFSGRDGRVLMTLLPAIPGHVKLQGERFGCAVAPAGDVDGDEAADLIIGAWGYSSATTNRIGCAQLFSGRTGRVLRTFFGSNAEDYFGSSIAGGRDIDGDRIPDLVIGATETRQPTPGPGYVRAFSGRDGSQIWRLAGTYSTGGRGAFGQSVALLDVDRDLRADVIVGSPYDTRTVTEAGTVYAFSGRTGQQLWAFSRLTSSDRLGWSVAATGDLDQDGSLDVIAGGPGLSQAGVALALSTKVPSPSVLYTWQGAPGDSLGTSVASAGDVDGDKRDDLIVGSWPVSRAGFADVFSGATGLPLFRVDGSFLTDEFEIARVVAGAGDVNGDGRADVVVGAPGAGPSMSRPGRAHVYSGQVLAMTAFDHEASLSRLGTVELRLYAGSSNKSKLYLLLGSMSGTSPGIKLGALTLPLNPINDTYFLLTLSYPNTLLLADSLGVLDTNGRARARFRAMPELPRTLVGRMVHHAFLVFGTMPFDFTSNAVAIRFIE